MKYIRLTPLFLNAFFISLNASSLAKAQVVPSGPSSTVVDVQGNSKGRRYIIDGGKNSGSNLFHFFDKFNLNEEQQAVFRNSRNINTIFSIVTGNTSSSINGGITANGKADISFFNPNGILLDRRAMLDIGGDFLASTANKLLFTDGESLSIEDPVQSNVLLNLSSGDLAKLQFLGTSGGIVINGTGHELEQQTPTSPATGLGDVDSGLSVLPGQTISLFANGIELSGGKIVAPAATILLISIQQGQIPADGFGPSRNISFSGEDKKNIYAPIVLDESSLIDTSGSSRSFVSIKAGNLQILGNSFIYNSYTGSGSGGTLRFDVSGDFLIDASSFDANLNQSAVPVEFGAGIISDAISGRGADIEVYAGNLSILQGASIQTFARNSALGGRSRYDIQEDVLIQGDSLINPLSNSSVIGSSSFDSASAGSIELSANNLFIRDSGILSALNLSSNSNEPVTIIVADTTQIDGLSPTSSIGSFLISSSLSTGSSADINLSTKRLNIFDGAVIASTTFGAGSGGDLNINAQESLSVSGFRIDPFDGTRFDSAIVASASALPGFIADPLNLPSPPTGDAGIVDITSPSISLDNFGTVSSFNQGSGLGGDIFINSDAFISNKGRVTAIAANDNGGNINLSIDGPLILSNQSQFTASSLGAGSGGNIRIQSDLITLSNSDILANAEQGTGGQITISTQGLFPDNQSRISATSDFGVDGQVEIDVENRPVLVDQVEIQQPRTNTVNLACSPGSSSGQSSFSMQSSGGLAAQPGNFSQTLPIASKKAAEPQLSLSAPFIVDEESGKKVFLVEPSGFHRRSDGTLAFVVEAQVSEERSVLVSSSCLPSSASNS
ncbi:hypothetical protein C1752_12233 [Acaryochloris thomasi RCC1774]|uniref:Filamentous haemagglutinin FhaB/tRNA nuclease CdiA-like TPS domain-containing protein n=1 Tax=Acaryochloris thomasi RCC1774 TaxID=1764569 RepID=A0A2W1J7R9_9CYAN|nr:filamentous hemagglutinin N-terminal domain-containing protein [Acaryochloris thomasi]PZD70450.1 hypothetical protein C1752_12233 [Acaryochloris thomasi RCC1774]